jgi:hypothetical protein
MTPPMIQITMFYVIDKNKVPVHGYASTNVVEIQTLGIVTIEIALAPASTLMQRYEK